MLSRSYDVNRTDVAAALRALTETRGVVLDRPVLDAGLAVMANGGDFADGVIAYEGACRGGETFVSFDRKAVSALRQAGRTARLP